MGLMETVSGTATGPRAGEKKQEGVPQLRTGWAVRGAEVSPRLCCCLGALLWSSCLPRPGSGLVPAWNRAHWLLLSFRVAFFERQRFLLRLLLRKWCGSFSLLGQARFPHWPSQLGWVSAPLKDLGGWTVPAFLQIGGRIHSLKRTYLSGAGPFVVECYSTGIWWIPWRDPRVIRWRTRTHYFSPLPIKGVGGDEQMSTPMLELSASGWTEPHRCAWELGEVWANPAPGLTLKKSPLSWRLCCKELGVDSLTTAISVSILTHYGLCASKTWVLNA